MRFGVLVDGGTVFITSAVGLHKESDPSQRPTTDVMNDSGGKFAILGRVESDDAQTMSGFPHSSPKKAVCGHVLWERSPLFGFPTRVMNTVPIHKDAEP